MVLERRRDGLHEARAREAQDELVVGDRERALLNGLLGRGPLESPDRAVEAAGPIRRDRRVRRYRARQGRGEAGIGWSSLMPRG
jgi:hypothetical protein